MRALNWKTVGFVSAFAVIMVALTATAESEVDNMNDDALRAAFREAPLKYRLNRNAHNIPMEGPEQEDFIRATLKEGWGGFALNVPYKSYLTDEGMKGTKGFCELARAKGMDLWLYDEQGYPSGNAGDRVINENPAWECMGIFFIHADVSGGENSIEMPPGKNKAGEDKKPADGNEGQGDIIDWTFRWSNAEAGDNGQMGGE